MRSTIISRDGFKRLLFHSALALTLTSGLSYIAGFVRDRMLATTFGASETLDVYYAAFVLPDFLLALFVTSSVSAAFVPLFIRLRYPNKSDARDYLYNILTIISSLIIFLGIVVAIAVPYLSVYLVPGFDNAGRDLYVQLVRVMLISPLIFAVSNIFGGVLLSVRDFFFYGIAPVFYNLGIIVGIMFFVPQHGAIGLAYGTILGASLHAVSRIGIGIVRTGLPQRSPWYWNAHTTRTVFLMLPKVAQIGAWQFLLGWFIHLASQMEEGSVTVYSLARNFQSMPVSLIGIAIALSAFATLSHSAADGNYTLFRKTVRQKSLLIVVLTTLSAIILVIIATPFITFFLGGGAFGEDAIKTTALVLMFYALSIPCESLMHILARAHYALKRTLLPSLIHIFAIGITIFVGWSFHEKYGIIIIPISFVIGLLIQNILLFISYKIVIKKCEYVNV